ncbi:MAG: hypothetical protein WKF61_04315 [Luteimonas sp.]
MTSHVGTKLSVSGGLISYFVIPAQAGTILILLPGFKGEDQNGSQLALG